MPLLEVFPFLEIFQVRITSELTKSLPKRPVIKHFPKFQCKDPCWGPRDGSRAATTSKMERFGIIVSGFQPLIIITKCSILDVAAALDLPLGPT